MSESAELAWRVLQTIHEDGHVSPNDALHLRALALSPKEALLPLEEIAKHILARDGHWSTAFASRAGRSISPLTLAGRFKMRSTPATHTKSASVMTRVMQTKTES
jgi:hypothetical protein